MESLAEFLGPVIVLLGRTVGAEAITQGPFPHQTVYGGPAAPARAVAGAATGLTP